MYSKKLLSLSIFLGLIAGYLVFSSSSAGQMGVSTTGCGGGGCHTSSTATTISLTGIPAGGWVAGQTYSMILTVSNSAQSKAGFDLSITSGTMSNAPANTMLMGGTELHHTSPLTMASGVASWSFSWTAPMTGSAVTFNIAGNAVNGNTNSTGDAYNTAALTFNVAAASATAPSVANGGVTAITQTTATVNGVVNANGASTDVIIEYGPTTAYGTSTAMVPSPVTGTTGTAVSASLGGLTANTTYHYRIRAINSVDTTWGTDATFMTSPSSVTDFEQAGIKMYPNPAIDQMTITLASAFEQAEFLVVSMSGSVQTVKATKVSGTEYRLNTSGLSAGSYILSIRAGEKAFTGLFSK